jgi:hypothetical protein
MLIFCLPSSLKETNIVCLSTTMHKTDTRLSGKGVDGTLNSPSSLHYKNFLLTQCRRVKHLAVLLCMHCMHSMLQSNQTAVVSLATPLAQAEGSSTHAYNDLFHFPQSLRE